MSNHPNRKLKTYRVRIHHGTMSRDITVRASCEFNAEKTAWRRLVNENTTESYMLTRNGRDDCNLITVELGDDGCPI